MDIGVTSEREREREREIEREREAVSKVDWLVSS